ncbi:MAG: hypothetical protein IKH15_12170 [Bacteroidales bacterium]|nr:hypothetical protein [Bacteroidales bacterium]
MYFCHKKENSKTRCVNGHYVCSECHSAGMDTIVGLCLAESSRNPVEILNRMMKLPFCHIHGPEHHVMVGAALLQTRLLSLHPLRHRFREGAFRHRDGETRSEMLPQPHQQPMYRKKMPVRTWKGIGY